MSERSRVTTPVEDGSDKKARLVVLLGIDAGRVYTIGTDAVIGRSSEAEVCLTASHISRKHARIFVSDGAGYVIEDLKSSNGTFVNGTAVERETLHFGDRISLGSDSMLLFTHFEPLESQLFQLQKMQAMGQLSAGVAHEYNNLLGAVWASLEYLMQLPRTGEFARKDVVESLEDASAACKRASELTKQLLDFANPSRPQESMIDVKELVEEGLQLMRRSLAPNIDLRTALESKLVVRGDRIQLLQALMNLLINARDAMPKGGRLSATATRTEPEGLGSVPIQSLLAHVVITIEDTGAGMDEKTCHRVFEPFFDANHQSTSGQLGLFTVFSVIRNHGGHVTVESQVGNGTTFRVYLPLTEGQAARRSTFQAEDDTEQFRVPGTEKPLCVLLVDDEALVLRSTERLLRNAGYDVFRASNGAEALDVYRSHKNSIEAVLLDLNMPDMNGEDTFRGLREIDEKVKVILFSGYWDEGRVRRILDEGALAVIRKPADGRTLKQALAQAIARF